MFCKNCGASLPNDAQFCTACGAKTAPFVQMTQPGFAPGPNLAPPLQPQYQAPPVYGQQKQVIVTDSSSPGAFVLGLLIPIIISIILYISWHKTTPKKAQSLLIGMVIRILPTAIAIFFIVMGMAEAAVGSV